MRTKDGIEYNVGDTVRIIKTDYPDELPVGSISKVVWSNTQGLDLQGPKGKLTFWNREVEPYKEEVNMNTQGIEVGDILQTKIKLFTYLVTGVHAINGLKIDHSNTFTPWSHINQEYHIKEKAVKMSDKIEVGDTVEYTLEHMNKAQRVVKAIVGTKLHFTNGAMNDIKDLKLVSKAKQNMKEVIGYKLKDKKYELAASTIASEGPWGSGQPFADFMLTAGDKGYAKLLREAGVLDLWFEPVYKASEVVVKLSKSRTATITSKTVGTINVGSEGKFDVTAKDVANAFTALNKLGQIAGYNVGIKEFNLGCQTFTIDDLIKVNQAFNDFK